MGRKIKKIIIYSIAVILIPIGILGALIGYIVLEHKIYKCPLIDFDDPETYIYFYPKFFKGHSNAYIHTKTDYINLGYFLSEGGYQTSTLKEKMEVFVSKKISTYEISISWNVAGCLLKKKFNRNPDKYQKDISIIVNESSRGSRYGEKIIYHGQAEDKFLIQASWKKKYNTEWDITVHWVSDEELKLIKMR